MTKKSKIFYSTVELAQRYGITAQTVRKLVHKGEFPAPLVIGGLWRWDEKTIAAFEQVNQGR